jgi:putative alpha-1,2-mannosidase
MSIHIYYDRSSRKTQKWVNCVISEEDGIGSIGLRDDEVAGQRSAWLAFSIIGFYQVFRVLNQHVIASTFTEVKYTMPDNKYFLISSLNRNGENRYSDNIAT